MKRWMIKEWLKFIEAHDSCTVSLWGKQGFTTCGAVWATLFAVAWTLTKTAAFLFLTVLVFALPLEVVLQLYAIGTVKMGLFSEVALSSITFWSAVIIVVAVFGLIAVLLSLASVKKCKQIKIDMDLFPRSK